MTAEAWSALFSGMSGALHTLNPVHDLLGNDMDIDGTPGRFGHRTSTRCRGQRDRLTQKAYHKIHCFLMPCCGFDFGLIHMYFALEGARASGPYCC